MVFIFHFDKPLLYNETVDVTISAGFTDYIGDILMEPYTFSFTTEPAPTFIESNPTDFVISTYPNPFNASTTLYYSLPNPDHVTLSVYSLTGQKVATLVDDTMNAGTHSAIFDGNGLSSGIYFYRFETPGFENTGKMLLVK
jgi:hypothetical protein